MAPADIAILAVIGLYVFFGLFHGFIVSLLRLGSLVAMFLVLTVFAEPLARALPFVQAVSFSDEMAFILVVGVAFVAIMLATAVVTFFIKIVPSGVAGRLLGGVIGLARASVFLVLAVIVSALMPPAWTHSHWQQSALLRLYGAVAEVALAIVPATGPDGGPSQLSRIDFDPATNQPWLPRRAAPAAADGAEAREPESFIPPAAADPFDAIKAFDPPGQDAGGAAGTEIDIDAIMADENFAGLRELTGNQQADPEETRRQIDQLLRQLPSDSLSPEARQAIERLLEAQPRP